MSNESPRLHSMLICLGLETVSHILRQKSHLHASICAIEDLRALNREKHELIVSMRRIIKIHECQRETDRAIISAQKLELASMRN